MKVQDGAGKGAWAKVDSTNRLYTRSISGTDLADSSQKDGLAYTFATGAWISLTTTGTEHAVFWLRNDDPDRVLEIHDVRSCATVAQQWIMYVDDDAGTIVSTANAATSVNMNRTSSNTSLSTQYYGADTLTRSGGVEIHRHINNIGHSTNSFEGALVLGKDNSVTLTCEVQSVGEVCVMITGHYANVT